MKRWVFDPLILIVIAGALSLVVSFTTSFFQEDPTPLLEEAYASYNAAEKTSNMVERQKLFNQSLKLYSELEEEYQPRNGNGRLYYNIGNAFYQLEAYPWAILNYYHARDLSPRDERVELSLRRALAKLNLPPDQESTPFESIFFAHTQLSLQERIQLFFLLAVLAVAAFSVYIWTEKRLWRSVGIVFSLITVALMLSLAYSYYAAPIEGVLIRSTLLYRDAGTQYAPVSEDPAPSGQKLSVLGVGAGGRWFKVETSERTVGFVPAESLRLIHK